MRFDDSNNKVGGFYCIYPLNVGGGGGWREGDKDLIESVGKGIKIEH